MNRSIQDIHVLVQVEIYMNPIKNIVSRFTKKIINGETTLI